MKELITYYTRALYSIITTAETFIVFDLLISMELAGIEPGTLETLLIKMTTLSIELFDPPKDCWNKCST